MRRHTHATFPRECRYLHEFTDTTYLGDRRLHDIDRAGGERMAKLRLGAPVLAGGERYPGILAYLLQGDLVAMGLMVQLIQSCHLSAKALVLCNSFF